MPGHDGLRGFGGMCLPKDISAFSSFAKLNKIDTPIIDSVLDRNNKIDRPNVLC